MRNWNSLDLIEYRIYFINLQRHYPLIFDGEKYTKSDLIYYFAK